MSLKRGTLCVIEPRETGKSGDAFLASQVGGLTVTTHSQPREGFWFCLPAVSVTIPNPSVDAFGRFLPAGARANVALRAEWLRPIRGPEVPATGETRETDFAHG